MPTVIVDGQEIEIGADERLNCIEVARRAGVEIPHYCWHPGLSVVASCRMCLIQAGTRNNDTGEISMIPKLVPGCQHQPKTALSLSPTVTLFRKVVLALRKHCLLITRLIVQSVIKLVNACCRTITSNMGKVSDGLIFMHSVAAAETLVQLLRFLLIAASCAHDVFVLQERFLVQQNSWSLPVVRKKK